MLQKRGDQIPRGERREGRKTRTSKDPAPVLIEPASVRLVGRRADAAPFVPGLLSRAVCAQGRALDRTLILDAAARAGVQRDLVVRVVVHALEDVDLATCGPVRACNEKG